MGTPRRKPIRFERLQSLRQHPFADAIQPPPQFGKPQGTVKQGDENQPAPAAGDVLQTLARGASEGQHVTGAQFACFQDQDICPPLQDTYLSVSGSVPCVFR